MSVLFAYISEHRKCAWCPQRPEASETLGLELLMVVRHCVGARIELEQQVFLITESALHPRSQVFRRLAIRKGGVIRKLRTHRSLQVYLLSTEYAPSTAQDFRNMEIHDTPHCASRGSSCGWSLERSQANPAGHMITSHLTSGSWFSLL